MTMKITIDGDLDPVVIEGKTLVLSFKVYRQLELIWIITYGGEIQY